jgi:uncharacterized membrane protein (DUF441 family)
LILGFLLSMQSVRGLGYLGRKGHFAFLRLLGDLVRAAFVFKHGCGSLPLYLGCHRTQAWKAD